MEWNFRRSSGYELAGNEIFLRHGSSGDWGGFCWSAVWVEWSAMKGMFITWESILGNRRYFSYFPCDSLSIMNEAEVVWIVGSSSAKKNENLLASVKSMLDDSLNELKRSQGDTADSHLKGSLTSRITSKIKVTKVEADLTIDAIEEGKKGSYCWRGRNTFFWPKSPTLGGHWFENISEKILRITPMTRQRFIRA